MNIFLLLVVLSADPVTPRAVIGGDETVVVGQMAELTATESENAKSYKWVIRPKPLSMKYANSEQSKLYISHDQPEIFEVELIVASPDGSLDVHIGELEVKGPSVSATATHAVPVTAANETPSTSLADTLTLVRQLKELQELLAPPQSQQVTNAPHMVSPLAAMGHPSPPPGALSWSDGIKRIAMQVRSNTRREEGKMIAGSFRMVADGMKTGVLQTNDPWSEAFRGSKEALGSAAANWNTFFSNLASYVDGMGKQGMLSDPRTSVDLLESAAQQLSSL